MRYKISGEKSKNTAWISTAWLPPLLGKQALKHLCCVLLVGNSTETMLKHKHLRCTTKDPRLDHFVSKIDRYFDPSNDNETTNDLQNGPQMILDRK